MTTPHEPHPLIVEMLRMLPQPDTEFGIHERLRWLRAMAAILDLLYGASDTDTLFVEARA